MRTRRLRPPAVLLALASLVVLLAAAPSAHAAKGMDIAVQDDAVLFSQRYFNRSDAYSLLRNMSVSRIRFNAGWAGANGLQAFQKSVPSNPIYDFTRIDNAIETARSQGMKVLLSITGPAPAWAAGDKRLTPQGTVRPNPRLFAKFVKIVVDRYKGRVDAYSIWNEPNHIGWLQPLKEQGTIYRGLFEAASRVVRKEDPAAKVIIAETAPYASKKTTATPPLQFLRQLACVDKAYNPIKGMKCKPLVADAWAHHPYDYTRPPNSPYPGADNVSMGGLSRLENALNRVARRKLLATPTGKALPLWLTEFGYFARKETGREKVYSEATRAKYLVQAFDIARKDPRVQVMLQYLLVEYPLGMFRFNTSIVHLDGTHMKTYTKLASWGRKNAARGEVTSPGPIIPQTPPTPPGGGGTPPPGGGGGDPGGGGGGEPTPCPVPIVPPLPCPV